MERKSPGYSQRVLFGASVALIVALATLPAEAAGKPPGPAPAPNPQVTFVDGSKLYVCDPDGGNKFLVHSSRDRLLRSPRMGPDRRSVLFVAFLAGTPRSEIRRVRFNVVDGEVRVETTDTIAELAIGPLQIALSPSGDRFTYVVNGVLYELEICEQPPCDPTAAAILFVPAAERFIEPVGGYSANGAAYFFEESGTSDAFDAAIRRLELASGVVETVLELPNNNMAVLRNLQPSRVDYGGVESRLLFDSADALYIFDTRTGQVEGPLGEGHYAAWSPDESTAISVRSFRYLNSVYGPLLRVDLGTGEATQLVKYGGNPDWR